MNHPIMSFSLLIQKLNYKITKPHHRLLKDYRSYFENKIGLEIGGPSEIFREYNSLPIYKLAERIDGVNFSNQTIWEGTIHSGVSYKYIYNKVGYQFICEGNELKDIDDDSYDFIVSSHNLEHFANPLKSIVEWKRVLRKGGLLMVIVPDRRYTFDHRRKVTQFQHLLEDFRTGTMEDDLTHLNEIISLHDISMDYGAKDLKFFKARSLKNFENRCLHHHVFDKSLMGEIFLYFKLSILRRTFIPPYNIITIGQKE